MNIPFYVVCILDKLEKAGYKAYIVGGAVRDMLLGKVPHDYDITTNAQPEDIKRVFENKCVAFAEKYGTITIHMDNEEYEVTTFRKESGYADSRHPDKVEWADTIEEDLARRDFTINAMALSVNGDIIDPFGGFNDLKEGVIRCVGNPEDRFKEDQLRILRAVRFASMFPGVGLDEKIVRTIRKSYTGNTLSISIERTRDELTKMLMSDNPGKCFIILKKLGVLASILPEVDEVMRANSKRQYILDAFAAMDNKITLDKNLRWGMLLSCVREPETVSGRLKFSNRDRDEILFFAKNKTTALFEDWEIRKFIAENKDRVSRLLCMQGLLWENTSGMSKWRSKCKTFLTDGSAILPADLKINGDDLMKLGYVGKDIALKRQELYEQVLRNPDLNDKETLIGLASEETMDVDR